MTQGLAASEYRILVENSPVMIWRSRLTGECDYFNETWLAFTGRSLDREIGQGWTEGVHADDLEGCVRHYMRCFERRESFEMEYRLRRHDGLYRWIFDRGVPRYDEAGAFAGFIGSCIDVEDRRQAQAAREKHDEEELAVARDFESWILAIVSHDIRSPLSAIDLAARYMVSTAEDSIAVKRHAERVTRGVDRIQHIVADLLDLSRERHGSGIPLKLISTDLRVICGQIIEEHAAVAKGREIALDCTGDTTGSWDAHRITQALSNLVGNALQHSPRGSPVRVAVRGDPDRANVSVYNEGAISPDLLPVIFEPFRSGGERPRTGEGLGLGLFIAKAIVRAHGGRIEVESPSDRSTTFRVVLPRNSSHHEPAAT